MSHSMHGTQGTQCQGHTGNVNKRSHCQLLLCPGWKLLLICLQQCCTTTCQCKSKAAVRYASHPPLSESPDIKLLCDATQYSLYIGLTLNRDMNLFTLWQGVRSRSCLSAERRHFSSPRKKHFYFTKSFPNGIIGCVERGFYKKNHPITCFRWSGGQVLFWPSVPLKSFSWPLSLAFLFRSAFLFSSIVLSLPYSPVNDFLPASTLAPPCFTFLGGIWNRWL